MKQKITDKLTYEDLQKPSYINTTVASRIGSTDLTTTDVMDAAVIAGLKLLMVGHSEKGKTFYATQVANNWFGGRWNLIQAASLDDNAELFTQVFKKLDEKAKAFVMDEEKLEYSLLFIDEIGAVPGPLKAQFYPIGDGFVPHKGKRYFLGTPTENGRFCPIIASTNTIREGNNGGYSNFGTTKPEASRYNVCIDLRGRLRRNNDSLLQIGFDSDVDPKYAEAEELKDITPKILDAFKEIKENAKKPSLEELLALNFLTLGSGRCMKGERTEDKWQDMCDNCDAQIDCPASNFYLYEMMRQAKNIRVFANALDYMARLKNPGQDSEADSEYKYDAVFEAAKFVIAGKYSTLNERLMEEQEQNDTDFVMDGIDKIKKEFEKIRGYLDASIDCLDAYGEVVTEFIHFDGDVLPVSVRFCKDYANSVNLKDKTGEEVLTLLSGKGKVVSPFNDNGYVSLSWIPAFFKMYKERMGK